MKFTILSHSKSGGRVGCLAEFVRNPDMCVETPLLFLHTKTGSVPYLAADVLNKVSDKSGFLQMDLSSMYDAADSVKDFGLGICKFVGLPGMLSYLSIYDPAIPTPPGYNHASGISLWRRNGRVVLNSEEHFKKIEAICPDVFEILADSDTGVKTTEKRAKKAVDRSLAFLETLVEKLSSSERLRNTAYLVPITGGDSLRNRERSIQAAKSSNCSGYVLSGLLPTGPLLENAEIASLRDVIATTIGSLNTPERLYHLPGPLSPSNVIELVEVGVDVFDSSLPYVVTERGCAFVFQNHLNTVENKENRNLVKPLEELPVATKSATAATEKSETRVPKPYEIDLRDPRFREDFRSLVPGCDCLACRKHTRAYVHHLLNVKELLGPILLMMHNLHHYLMFFQSIRQSIKDDCLRDLKEVVVTNAC